MKCPKKKLTKGGALQCRSVPINSYLAFLNEISCMILKVLCITSPASVCNNRLPRPRVYIYTQMNPGSCPNSPFRNVHVIYSWQPTTRLHNYQLHYAQYGLDTTSPVMPNSGCRTLQQNMLTCTHSPCAHTHTHIRAYTPIKGFIHSFCQTSTESRYTPLSIST